MQDQIINGRRLTDPAFHDGYLKGIVVEGNTVDLHLTDHNGTRFIMSLESVTALLADDFQLGNIIYDFEIFAGTLPPSSYLDALHPPLDNSVAQRFHQEDIERRSALERRILDGTEMLIFLNSTYGCVLSALCQSFVIRALP